MIANYLFTTGHPGFNKLCGFLGSYLKFDYYPGTRIIYHNNNAVNGTDYSVTLFTWTTTPYNYYIILLS